MFRLRLDLGRITCGLAGVPTLSCSLAAPALQREARGEVLRAGLRVDRCFAKGRLEGDAFVSYKLCCLLADSELVLQDQGPRNVAIIILNGLQVHDIAPKKRIRELSLSANREVGQPPHVAMISHGI